MKTKLKSILTKERVKKVAASLALGTIIVFATNGLVLGGKALYKEFTTKS